jgi:FAD:protein FMN transferase
MGTHWQISIWDSVNPPLLTAIQQSIATQSAAFCQLYSRFDKTSLVWKLAAEPGTHRVPADLVTMLRLYEALYRATDGKCNPLIGFSISDLGYDADYSLKAKAAIRPVPELPATLRILDDETIELRAPALIDLGALGKGFFVDTIAAYLDSQGLQRFLVDGSGDVYYQTDGPVIQAGLEHPDDSAKVIGVVEMGTGAMCSSGRNRRAWGNRHHIIDATSLHSPEGLLSSWVLADSAVLADALATCLFLVPPETLQSHWPFSCCLLNSEYRVKRSPGFRAELF